MYTISENRNLTLIVFNEMLTVKGLINFDKRFKNYVNHITKSCNIVFDFSKILFDDHAYAVLEGIAMIEDYAFAKGKNKCATLVSKETFAQIILKYPDKIGEVFIDLSDVKEYFNSHW
ncbi:MAG: hypothetical protein Q8936_11700 [Bacillota bacterium]|nr:hypothetical protein [Bacillota bacterium]